MVMRSLASFYATSTEKNTKDGYFLCLQWEQKSFYSKKWLSRKLCNDSGFLRLKWITVKLWSPKNEVDFPDHTVPWSVDNFVLLVCPHNLTVVTCYHSSASEAPLKTVTSNMWKRSLERSTFYIAYTRMLRVSSCRDTCRRVGVGSGPELSRECIQCYRRAGTQYALRIGVVK